MKKLIYKEIEKMFEFMRFHLRNDPKGMGEEKAFNENVIEPLIRFVEENIENLSFSKMAFGYLISNKGIQIGIGDGTGSMENIEEYRNLSQTGLCVYITKNKEDFKVVQGSNNNWITDEIKS
jgi:hypothetical protein